MLGHKAALRQQFLAQRPDNMQRQNLSDSICQHLATFLHRDFPVGQTVLAYWPHRQEPDLSGLLRNSWYAWGLPKCLPNRQLAWYRWQWGEPLVTNSYGIEEPLATALPIDLVQTNVLILPAIAIDRQGYRLGYGGGYYDRLLGGSVGQQLVTIGVVFAAAYIPCLPVDDWDRPVHYVCTELGVQAIDR
jgi:5-formyltetrahydrofolate cyclo-ligase